MERSTPERWVTALTRIAPGRIEIRGVDVARLMREATFAEAVYLMLRGRMPSPAHGRVMNAILTSSIDHGLTPPSSLAARTVVSGGNPLNAAVAAGILTIGESHGGAIEACARLLQEHAPGGRGAPRAGGAPVDATGEAADGEGAAARAAGARVPGDVDAAAERLVDGVRRRGERVPGFGHRLHDPDPRTVALFEIADAEGVCGVHVALARAVERVLAERTGRRLPINVDGAIAALISDMGFDWRLGKGFFIVSRTPGLVAHAVEERTREKPMRRMLRFETEYDGPRADSGEEDAPA